MSLVGFESLCESGGLRRLAVWGSWSLPPGLVIREATLCSPSRYRVHPEEEDGQDSKPC